MNSRPWLAKKKTKTISHKLQCFNYLWHTENSLLLFYLKHNTKFVFMQQIMKCIQFNFEVSLLHFMLTPVKIKRWEKEEPESSNMYDLLFSLKAVEDLFILLYFSLISTGTQYDQCWMKEEIPQEGFTSLGCLMYLPDILRLWLDFTLTAVQSSDKNRPEKCWKGSLHSP